MNDLIRRIAQGNLVIQIIIGLILGIALALVWPDAALQVGLLGDFFVGALKSIAPILVFILVTHAIAKHQRDQPTNIRSILVLYVIGTFVAALSAVMASYISPVVFTLNVGEADITPPSGLAEVLKTLVLNMVDNPVSALGNGNYIGILVWATLIGFALQHSQPASKALLDDASAVISKIVALVVRLAPLGVFGLIARTLADTGIAELWNYAHVLASLVGVMVFVALVANPLMVWFVTRENPYPLVFKCLAQSGITAFFMRSSAANIPVNLSLAKELNLREETYSISIPLGANINMAGASITITTMAMAAANTLGLDIHPMTAVLLCFLATLGACGASGVPGGSLLLIPMACSLLGIDGSIAAQVVGVGFIIGVVQDSFETGLNSSTDVLFTAAVDRRAKREASVATS